MNSKVGGLTYQQVVDAWNAQADEYNQWCELDDEEKVNWTIGLCFRSQSKEDAARYRWLQQGKAITVKCKKSTILYGTNHEKDYGDELSKAIDIQMMKGAE